MTTQRNIGINRSPALRTRRLRPALGLALASLVLGALPACARDGDADSALSRGRVYAPAGRTIDWSASSAQRFGSPRPANRPVAPAPAPAAAEGAGSGFRWKAPASWQRGPDKAMREVTYLAGEQGEVECYVTLLSGEGGGVASNLDRWRGQLGQPPLAPEEVAALPRIPMLGAQAVAIEITRAAAQAEGPEMMLGAVCLLPGQSLFVKLLGPRAAVEAQREAFLDFCKSAEAAK